MKAIYVFDALNLYKEAAVTDRGIVADVLDPLTQVGKVLTGRAAVVGIAVAVVAAAAA